MENLDLFSIPFQLNYKNKPTFSNALSQTNSIIFFSLSTICFVYYIVVMTQRSEISINSYRTGISEKDMVTLNDSNSFFGFSIYDSYDNWLKKENSTIFKHLQFKAKSIFFNGKSDYTELEVYSCNFSVNREFFNVPNYPSTDCLNFNNSMLKGNFYSFQDVALIVFTIGFDKNSYFKETNTSSLPDEDLYMYLYFPIISANLYNYNKPTQTSNGYYLFRLNVNEFSAFSMSFEITEILTNKNFFGEDLAVEASFSPTYKFIPTAPMYYKEILELTLFLDPSKTIYFRKYLSFQGVLNNINSVVSFLFLFLKSLTFSLNKISIKFDFLKENISFQFNSVNSQLTEFSFKTSPVSSDLTARERNVNFEYHPKKHSPSSSVINFNPNLRNFSNDPNILDQFSPIFYRIFRCHLRTNYSEDLFKPIFNYYDYLLNSDVILKKVHRDETTIKLHRKSQKSNKIKRLTILIDR